jgi:hypothetical protein
MNTSFALQSQVDPEIDSFPAIPEDFPFKAQQMETGYRFA